jgi:hypothetical protein
MKMGRRLGETYRRADGVGVWAFKKRHQLFRGLLATIAVSKRSFTSPDADTPTRRNASPADGTFSSQQNTCHFGDRTLDLAAMSFLWAAGQE